MTGLLNEAKDFGRKLSLLLAITSLSIFLVIICKPLYLLVIDYFQIPQSSGMDKTTIVHNYDQLLHFLFNPLPKKLVLSDFFLSAQAQKHFSEVRLLFFFNFLILLISIILTFLYLRKLKINQQLWRLFLFSKNALIIVPFIALLTLLFFEPIFLIFHEIFFRNNFWLFDPIKDPIIKILPVGYFAWCFGLFFVFVELFFLILFLFSFFDFFDNYTKQKTNDKNNQKKKKQIPIFRG